LSIQVVVRPETFELSSQGSVIGVIFVRADGRSFPDDSWSDFPLVILSWWIEHLTSDTSERAAALRFMEGPYYLEICRGDSGKLATLSLIDEGVANPAQFPIRLADFCAEVSRAAETAATECGRRHWATPDLDELNRALRRFKLRRP
jgi:hypothetical protein